MPREQLVPPKIGSVEWDRELAAIGVDRAVVDEEIGAALSACGTAELDPHSLDLAGTPAEIAAAWVLIHQDHPSYSVLMYLRFVWFEADRALRD